MNPNKVALSARYIKHIAFVSYGMETSDWVHIGLDLLGLVPGPGELADMANLGMYIGEGDWFDALLSVISMVPALGDAVAKPIRWAIKMGKQIPSTILLAIKHNSQLIIQTIQKLTKHPKFGQYVSNLIETLTQWLASAVFTNLTE